MDDSGLKADKPPLAKIEIAPLAPEEFKEELERLVELYREAYRKLGRYGYRGRSQIRGYLRWLYGLEPEGFLVARTPEGEPVGFIAVCRHWLMDESPAREGGEIHELVVGPRWQGRGIGSRLLEAGIEFLAREHELLGLWVGEKNTRAIEFYKRRGFTEVGKAGPWLRMIKRLSPVPG